VVRAGRQFVWQDYKDIFLEMELKKLENTPFEGLVVTGGERFRSLGSGGLGRMILTDFD
jgi:hypothetical protein